MKRAKIASTSRSIEGAIALGSRGRCGPARELLLGSSSNPFALFEDVQKLYSVEHQVLGIQVLRTFDFPNGLRVRSQLC